MGFTTCQEDRERCPGLFHVHARLLTVRRWTRSVNLGELTMSHWRAFQGFLFFVFLVVFGGCASMSVAAPEQPLTAWMVPVCSKLSQDPLWAFSETQQLVPSTDEAAFRHAVADQGRFYIYDPQADPRNSVTMPIPYNKAPCGETVASGPLVQRSRVQFVAGNIMPIDRPTPCKLLRDRAFVLFEPVPTELHAKLRELEPIAAPDGRWLGQTAHTRGGGVRMPTHPDPVRLAQDDARAQAINLSWDSGDKFGSTVAGIETGLETLNSRCSRFEEDLREHPEILEIFQQKIAKTLNDIPLPPQYNEPELKGLAIAAFSRGFEHGFGTKKMQFLALNTSATIAILIFPNIYLIGETLAAKAVRLALERVRSIPIYVPAMTSGAGFFMKLPKAPPANANGPAIPEVRPPPVILPPPPPPFGNLSRAAEFGVLNEAKMAKAIVGTGLQRHHLFEQRFGFKMDGDPRMNLTIALSEAEHQVFTNKWRDAIPYGAAGTHNIKYGRAEIFKAAREIYKNYPAILKALDL